MFHRGGFVLLFLIGVGVYLVHAGTAASSFPVHLSISQEKRFFPTEVSAYTQHVNIQIKTGANPGTQSQLPRQLFIVLDSSGSMAGADKWGNAVAAIEQIIRSMNRNDKIHLVEYSSSSSVVFENSNDQKTMLKALHALYPSGGTNLMAGFDTVIPLLKKYADRSTVNRLFVLSDGQINEGVTDHRQLLGAVTAIKKTYDLSVCSFGIGYDFDETLMTNIADYGSGDYFFIKGAESMEKVVGIAYRGFQNLMGTDAYLKLLTKYRTEITDVYGYELKGDDEQIIPIGNLRYNDAMDVLLETKVQITQDLLSEDAIEYMIVELWMHDVTDRSLKLVDSKTVQFSLSEKKEELAQSNEIVTKLVELQKIQRKEEEVAELLKQERIEEARHVQASILSTAFALHESLTNLIVTDSDDLEMQGYSSKKAATILRRSAGLSDSFSKYLKEPEKLVKETQSSQRLNKRYSMAYDDL